MECWSKIRDVNNGYLMLTILTPPVVTLLMKMQWITLNFGMITFRLTWSIDFLHSYVTLFCVILFWHLSAFWLLLWDVTATMFHWLRNLRSFSTPSSSLLRSMRTWHSRSGVRTILIFFSTLDLAIIHQYWECPQLCEKGSFDPNTFYSRGVLFNDDSSFSRKHVAEHFGTSQEIWRPQYCSAYLYCWSCFCTSSTHSDLTGWSLCRSIVGLFLWCCAWIRFSLGISISPFDHSWSGYFHFVDSCQM